MDAIAVIGMACRFPGCRNVEEFWANLRRGQDCITYFSDEDLYASGVDPSWIGHSSYVKAGGILEGIEMFDADFFGFTAREAALIDPQHRLLLECSWEALESAGYPPGKHPGSVGVFAGSRISDYLLFNQPLVDLAGLSPALPEASLQVLIANDKDHLCPRIAYALNLKGPVITVQTTCSTSLVAVHLACQSLLDGECDLALAGGVSIRIPQRAGYVHSEGLIFSRDGRTRTFDAQANGTVFSSGAGMVALKRLGDALGAGDLIQAIIRGSAVNNDGSSLKAGYTAPSAAGQAEVISEALAVAGVPPDSVSCIEAHGTATSLGDPIEVEALKRVFGSKKRESGDCALGSVKSNIGHLVQASGIAGLIKTVLMLRHKTLVPSLHFERPNPEIDFSNSPFYVNTRCCEWKTVGAPRRAGVSSFGVGGTNAHVVLEEPPAGGASGSKRVRGPCLLALSAKCDEALTELAGRFRQQLQASPASISDLCFSAATTRAHFNRRLALVASSCRQAAEQLAPFVENGHAPRLLQGIVDPEAAPAKICFLFTGQGSQYAGMGRQLYRSQPAFRHSLDRCDELLRPLLGEPLPDLLDSLFTRPGTKRPAAFGQTVLAALQYSLSRMWRMWGVEPQAVLGHSLGEYSAACAAGALGLEDMLRLVEKRACLMQELPRKGAMAAVFAAAETVAEAIEAHGAEVSIAAVNGAENVVISGSSEPLGKLLDQFTAGGIRWRRLSVAQAFHSPLIEPIMQPFQALADQVKFSPPAIPWVSSLTGRSYGPHAPDALYWKRHLRQPVLFASGMKSLQEMGCSIFLEIGPGTSLLAMGRRCLPRDYGIWLPSLRQGRDEARLVLESLASLYVQGAWDDWEAFYRGREGRRVSLPTYAFQRSRHWVKPAEDGHLPLGRARIRTESARQLTSKNRTGHALIGCRLASPLPEIQFEALFGSDSPPFLRDHQVFGQAVFPAVGFLEMALAAAAETFPSGCPTIRNLAFREALMLPGGRLQTVHLILSPGRQRTGTFRIHSRSAGGNEWALLVSGDVERGQAFARPPSVSLQEVQTRCGQEISPQAYYRKLDQEGLHHGPAFQGIKAIWKGRGEALGRIEATSSIREDSGSYAVHPALLSACLKLVEIADLEKPGSPGQETYMPLMWERATLHAPIGGRVWSHAKVRPKHEADKEIRTADVQLLDDLGNVLMDLEGLHFKRTSRRALLRRGPPGRLPDLLYQIEWRPRKEPFKAPISPPSGRGLWIIFADQGMVGTTLSRLLREDGQDCLIASMGRSYRELQRNRIRIDPARGEDFQRLLSRAFSQGTSLGGIVHLWSLDSHPAETTSPAALEGDMMKGCGSVLHLLQALNAAASQRSPCPRLWLTTCGAHSVGAQPLANSPAQAPLWGLGRVAAQEFRELCCTLVDLDPGRSDRENARSLQQEIFHAGEEDQVAWRKGRRHVLRLARCPASRFDAGPQSLLRQEATYLITGGLGGIGIHLAHRLADWGVRHLVLLGRGAPSGRSLQALKSLEEDGVRATAVGADVCRREELAAVFEDIGERLPPVRGVIHAAGLLDEALLAEQDWGRFKKILAPKVEGAWNLHLLTRKLELDFFVLFSSMASLFSPLRRGSYAAANAFLAALANYRRSLALPAAAIEWGPWAGLSMSTAGEEQRGRLEESYGLGRLSLEEGLEAFGHFLAGKPVQIGCIPVQWPSYFQRFPESVPPPFYRDLQIELETSGPTRQRRPQKTPPEGRIGPAALGGRRRLTERLAEEVSSVLGVDPSDLATDQPVYRLGVDSLMSIELRNRLQARLGVEVPMAQFLAGPSIEQIASMLLESREQPRPESGARRTQDGALTDEEAWEEGEL